MKKPLEHAPETDAQKALRFYQAYIRAVNLNNSAYQLSDALTMAGQPRLRMLAEIVLRVLTEAHVFHALSDTPLPIPDPTRDPRLSTFHALMATIRETIGPELANDVANRVVALSRVSGSAQADDGTW